MKQLLTLFLSMVTTLVAIAQNIQVSPGSGNYPTLEAAFLAISSGTHTGTVTVRIVGNTTETGSCSLSPLAAGTSVRIIPVGMRTVSGSIDGAPLIDINGADNITIDGLNADGNSLTIANNSISSAAQTGTVAVKNDATSVAIRNCTLLGSSRLTPSAIGGTLFIGNTFFGTSATGNDQLVIENNRIGPSEAGFPSKAVYSNGFSTNQPSFRERIQFTGNAVYDFFGPTGLSYGMLFLIGKSTWFVRNNHFFQTTTKTHTANAAGQYVIAAEGLTATGTALIENNIIGFASKEQTGRYTILAPGVSSLWNGIRVSGASSTVRGNTIKAITIDGASSGSGINNPFSAIYSNGPGANVVGNVIGDSTTAASINYTTTATGASWVYGVWANGTSGAMRVDNNTIAGIKINGPSTTNLYLNGIDVNGQGADTIYMFNNRLGSNLAPLENLSLGSFSRVVGITSVRSHCIIANNLVRYLYAETGNIGSTTGNAITGIEVRSASGTPNTTSMVMSGNTIHHLRDNHPTLNVWIKGIDFQGPAGGTHSINGNFIHNLLLPQTNNVNATIAGIATNSAISGAITGTTVIANNMLALGTALTTNSVRVNGIIEGTSGNLASFFFNTIYIAGSVTGGSSAMSVGIRSYNTNRTIKNNIVQMVRTNTGGTGKHYAMLLGGAGTGINPPGLASNRNVLVAPNAGGFICLYGAVECATLTAWKNSSGQDANSVSADPLLLAPAAATPDLHLNPASTSPAEDIGEAIASITIDFDGEIRSATPDAGADEKNAALPVLWGSFEAFRKQSYNLLNWTTLQEAGVAGFHIQRAYDGRQFETIGWQPSQAPQGNSAQLIHYSYTDAKAAANTAVYYRLVQKDLNGSEAISKVVFLPTSAASEVKWQLAGTAASSQLMGNLVLPQAATCRFALINAQGNIVRQFALSLPAGRSVNPIAVDALPAGAYFISLHIPALGFLKTEAFIKN